MNLCHKFIFSLLVYYGLNCTSFAIKKDHSSYKFLSTSFFTNGWDKKSNNDFRSIIRCALGHVDERETGGRRKVWFQSHTKQMDHYFKLYQKIIAQYELDEGQLGIVIDRYNERLKLFRASLGRRGGVNKRIQLNQYRNKRDLMQLYLKNQLEKNDELILNNMQNLPLSISLALELRYQFQNKTANLQWANTIEPKISSLNNHCLQSWFYDRVGNIIIQEKNPLSFKQDLLMRTAAFLEKSYSMKMSVVLYKKAYNTAVSEDTRLKVLSRMISIYGVLEEYKQMAAAVEEKCVILRSCKVEEMRGYADYFEENNLNRAALVVYKEILRRVSDLSDVQLAYYLVKVGILSKNQSDLEAAYNFIKENQVGQSTESYFLLARYEAKGISRTLDKYREVIEKGKFETSFLEVIEKKADQVFILHDLEASILAAYYTAVWFETYYQTLEKGSFLGKLFSYSKRNQLREKMVDWLEKSYKFYLANIESDVEEGLLAYKKLARYKPDTYLITNKENNSDFESLIKNVESFVQNNYTKKSRVVRQLWQSYEEGNYLDVLSFLFHFPQMQVLNKELAYLDTLCLIHLNYLKEAYLSANRKKDKQSYAILSAITLYKTGDYRDALDILENNREYLGEAESLIANIKRQLYRALKRYDLAVKSEIKNQEAL